MIASGLSSTANIGGADVEPDSDAEARNVALPQEDGHVTMMLALDFIYNIAAVLDADALQVGIAVATAATQQSNSLTDPGTRIVNRWQLGPNGWVPASGNQPRDITTGSTKTFP